MPSTAFNHVGISVRDLEREASFYTDAFDLREEFRFTVEAEGIHAVILRSPDGWAVELMTHPASVPHDRYDTIGDSLRLQGMNHFCLEVEDIAAVHDRLVELGGRSIVSPSPAPHPAITFAYVADPEGHFVELIHIAPGAVL